ncbi:MAG: lipase secretion chaperone [Pedobacter sp.]|nr:lipase secretion chaperone [Pedobacter sp.]
MEKKLVLGLAALIALLLAGIFFFAGGPADSADAQAGQPGALSADGQPITQGPSPDSFVTGLEQLPNSLQGTEVDGELEVDAGGHLKITNGVRRVFDYFLSTIGEESLDTIVARIKAYIRHKLPPMAAGEAEALLDKYIAYKRGLENVRQAQPRSDGSIDVSAVRQQMQQVQALRTQYFSAEVITAFFGDEDAYDRYTLDRLDVMQNKGLSPAQRAQQLAALEAQLPVSIQESMKTVNQYQNLESLTADWKKRGGSAAELRQIRESLVGAEAADRLETLDKDRAAWDQRMSSWYGERAAILGNTSLSEADRKQQLAELRNSRFSTDERLRVESLERMHDRGETVSP